MWILYTQIYLMRKIENYKFDSFPITVKLWSFNIIENCTYQHISLVPTLFLTSLSFHIPVLYVSRSCYNKTPQPELFYTKETHCLPGLQGKHLRSQCWQVRVLLLGFVRGPLVHASCLASGASMSNSWPLSCITSSHESDVLVWVADIVWHRRACTSIFIGPIWTLPTSLHDVHALFL